MKVYPIIMLVIEIPLLVFYIWQKFFVEELNNGTLIGVILLSLVIMFDIINKSIDVYNDIKHKIKKNKYR